jgi:hypothetical protein
MTRHACATAGCCGTPLAKKLGVKEGGRVAAPSPPRNPSPPFLPA